MSLGGSMSRPTRTRRGEPAGLRPALRACGRLLPAAAAALLLFPRVVSATGEGFLSTGFIHDSVAQNQGFEDLTHYINQDSLAANIRHLQDYGTRYAYTPQVIRAGRWLMRRFAGFGYSDTLYQAVVMSDGKVRLPAGNVVATKPGSRRPECRVIVGSHYDSITYNQSVPASEVAPGADDNASGTSVVLEMARILRDVDLDATVQFVSFTGHEVGMLGSFEFVEQLVEEGVPPERLFFLNLDMIGNAEGRGPWGVKIHDNVASRPLARLASRIGTAYTPLLPVMAGIRNADHHNFYDEGYRAIFLHEGDFNTPNYHSVTDLLKYLEMEYLEQVAEMATAIVLHLATLAPPPEDLAARETEDGSIIVEWTHSPDADVVGYHVELLDRSGAVLLTKSTPEDSILLGASDLGDATIVRVRAEDTLGEGEASAAVPIGRSHRVSAVVTPNPTSGPCSFHVFVPGTGAPVDAIVRVVDAAGRLVAVVHDAPLARGSNLLGWDGRSSRGDPAPTGVYF
jgi:aminopeptidase YwaD